METKLNIRAVIFDLGGVILRTEDPEPRLAVAARLGMTRAELEEIVFNNPVAREAERGQVNDAAVWAEVARRLQIPLEEIPDFSHEFFRGDRIDRNLVEFIRGLRPRYRTGLLSNTWTVDLASSLQTRYKIIDTFDVIISSAQQKMRKPEPEIFYLVLRELGVRPEEAVFVDDFQRNVKAAVETGIHGLHFTSPEQAIRDLHDQYHVAE